jgi:putative acetyltransferase
MLIRAYDRPDAPSIVRLFYETIHSINLKDYPAEQLHAWAPEIPDADIWHSRMIQRCTLVAEENGEILVFAEMEYDGHLDMMYCRHDAIGSGVGRQLYQAIEAKALDLGLARIFAEASITAKRFFTRNGFVVDSEQSVIRRGIALTNFRMHKQLQQR